MITIVDYGVGNIGALVNMFDYLGIEAEASGDPLAIARAESLVLPGIGAFDKAVERLRMSSAIDLPSPSRSLIPNARIALCRN